MVDTVLLHTAGSEERATRLAQALTDRNAITYPVDATQRGVGFGPQVVVVGVVPDAPQTDEERLLDLVQASPGLRLILTAPQAPPPFLSKAKDCVVLSAAADAEGDAALVRTAIADAIAAKEGGKKKRKPAPPRPTSTRVAETKPAPRKVRPPKEAPAERKAEKPPREFDPGAARRARKFGYFFGVVLGAVLAVTVVLAYLHAHAPQPSASVAPQPPAANAAQLKPASQPAAPAPAPAQPPSAQSPAPAATTPETHVAPPVAPGASAPPPPASPATDEALRGHLEQQQQP